MYSELSHFRAVVTIRSRILRVKSAEPWANLQTARTLGLTVPSNLQTARTLGLTVPSTLLAIADEVIE